MKRKVQHDVDQRPESLAKDVLRLSRLLTRERDDLPRDYLRDPDLRNAYRFYYLPANTGKVHLPLQELSCSFGNLLIRERLRVLDLGSGPGTAVLGILDFLTAERYRPFLEATIVDQVAENLETAKSLFRERCHSYTGGAELRTLKQTVSRKMEGCEGSYDIILFSNILNELYHGEAERVARRIELVDAILRRLLAKDGSCIFIEPALRETSRELLQVRDGMIEHGFAVYAPCLTQDHCPALFSPKDWCHEDIPWSAPDLVADIDRITGLRKDSLKFSYLVLRKDGRTLGQVRRDDTFRVVSEPLLSKGKRELFLCGTGGRRIAVRQDKDRSEANAGFDGLRRGSVAMFGGMLSEEKRFRVVKGTTVAEISRPGGVAAPEE